MKPLRLNVLIACLVAPAAEGGESSAWYVAELEDGASLTGKLLSTGETSFVLQFQGEVLELAKSRLQYLRKATLPVKTESPRGETAADGEARAARVLEAIEALGSQDTVASDRAFGVLVKEIETARPLLHAALVHRSPQVRVFLTKLLGEAGTAEEDLESVSGRLSDAVPEVRLAAIMAIRKLGPRGGQALLDHLERESVPNNRKMAVKAFQVWNDRSAVDRLLRYQPHEKDPGVQRFLETALETLIGRRGRSPGAWAAHLQKMREEASASPKPSPK